uniref:PNPLA domain-containing protein n=1 Tax=Alexandrium monilatum TaxID=311494 RepID=A0A7S4VKK4_9DINO
MAASQVFASAVQAGLWYTFHVLTVGWHVVQRFASRVLPAKDRAPQRLPPPRWLSVSAEGRLVGLEQLPALPALPFVEMEVAFAGCANLAMYMYGVAYALQQAPGSGSVRWTYSGASSGAFVAAPFAMGINCADVLLNAHRRFVKERERVGGCIGVYSCNVRGILHDEIEAARSAGLDPLQAADGRLAVSVTSLSPHPTHTVVTEFRSDQALLDAVLASCYIPVAYEQPIVLDGLGFCIDGCVSAFLPNTRCVVSPYHCHLADVTPTEEYEGTLVFNLLHGDDVLRLFEVRSPRGVRPSWRCCSRDSASS